VVLYVRQSAGSRRVPVRGVPVAQDESYLATRIVLLPELLGDNKCRGQRHYNERSGGSRVEVLGARGLVGMRPPDSLPQEGLAALHVGGIPSDSDGGERVPDARRMIGEDRGGQVPHCPYRRSDGIA